jgi:hypothetical protein
MPTALDRYDGWRSGHSRSCAPGHELALGERCFVSAAEAVPLTGRLVRK